MGTILVVAVILGGVIASLAYLRRSKQHSGCSSCSSCDHCGQKENHTCAGRENK